MSSTVKKLFVSPESLRADSVRLALAVVKSGWQPDFLVALWRGGASIGIVVHEVFKYKKQTVDHIAIRTSRSTGVDTFADTVVVHNLGYLHERMKKTSRVLVVDDIWDSGRTADAVLAEIGGDVRVATLYFKPSRNESKRVPEYYVHITTDWVVFPHELEELTQDEIEQHMGKEVAALLTE
jgi:uncharacterized protein